MTSFPGFSTDVVARQIFSALLRDFRVAHGQDFARSAELALERSVQEFRLYEWPKVGFVSPQRFKAWWQLRNLFKRHIFTSDVYTEESLEAKTVQSFVDAQQDFSTWRAGTPRTFAVLQEARRINREILGKFDFDEAASLVQIGKRATLGNPRNDSYLDRKMGDPRAFTCPSAARGWLFNSYLPTDPILSGVVKRIFKESKKTGKPVDLAVDFLNLVNVPKSWKTLRSITPLSNIGLFLSYGIGNTVTERLRKSGLNISSLQAKHRILAKRYSTSRSHVTADLSRASDSIMSQHLNAVLPRDWYRALRLTFIRQLRIGGGRCIYNASVLPMGNNATFPIETLFFYSIIKAVGNLLNVRGTYSVYGDDLIYPRRIHSYVLRVFAELGISINEDKTFVESYFRESCGGDYYRGIDVRPALLPETRSHLYRKRYAAYLYKVLNALRARWDEAEIPQTINWLLSELTFTQGVIFRVPLHFPDTAGYKTDVLVPNKSEWYIPWAKPKAQFKHGQVMVRFRYLGTATPRGRVVESQDIYYWDTLRAMSLRPPLEWRWWKSWLAELPQRECPLHQGMTLRSELRCVYVPETKKRKVSVKEWVYTTPNKEDGGYVVASEVSPLFRWTQEVN